MTTIKNYTTLQSTKLAPQLNIKHQLLQDAFSDTVLFKHRSQSNTDVQTPKHGLRVFQVQRQRGQTRGSEVLSVKSMKRSTTSVIKVMSKPLRVSRDELIRSLHNRIAESDDHHEWLIGQFEMFRNVVPGLEANHMMLQDRVAVCKGDDLKDDIYIMLHNSAERILKSTKEATLGASQVKKVHKRTALSILSQMQELVNHLLGAVVKFDVSLARMIEQLWKVVMLSVELLMQNQKVELENIEHFVLSEINEELALQKKENRDLYDKCVKLQNDLKDQQHHEKQELNNMQYQINMVRAEYNDFRVTQEQMSTFEHATGAMKDVDHNLKETTTLLNKIEDGLHNRDFELFHSMKAFVGHYKLEKDSEMTSTQRIAKTAKLATLQPKHAAILTECFSHPFIPHLAYGVKSNNECNVQQLLLDWFHHECRQRQTYGSHEIQLHLDQIASCIKKSPPELLVIYLTMNNQLDHLSEIVETIRKHTEQHPDINSLSKQDKQIRYFYHLISVILMMDPVLSINLEYFECIKQFYSSIDYLRGDEDESPQHAGFNKFTWYSFVVANLPEMIQLIISEDHDKYLNNAQLSVTQLIMQGIQLENDKQRNTLKKLIEDNQLKSDAEQEKDLQAIKINTLKELLISRYAINPIILNLLIMQMYERNLKLSQNKLKKQQKRITNTLGLDYNEWTNFIQESIAMIESTVSLNPSFMLHADFNDTIISINQETVKLLTSQTPPQQLQKKNSVSKVVTELMQKSTKIA